jgi:hypothetical protein
MTLNKVFDWAGRAFGIIGLVTLGAVIGKLVLLVWRWILSPV